ncbi:hypothetical protein [Paracoccus sediminilitoris]|uniref:hypothetical protein n=1 Tax=Paracoccus sediminilitoris TaxID=2202419 RepID=UPI001F1AEDBC|nr:hypothetical protein [Paracoccus sediminilitoris]
MIRSQGNSRGKSTIAELIFFALGGDLTTWKIEAGICDQTLAEVSLNGSTLTLRRDISKDAKQVAMWIYFGTLEESSKSGPQGWSKYSYSRYGDKDGFSQVLFRALNLPDVPSDESNITMHQLLRLMYVDQMTPVNAIFRMEERDSPNRRQAVGDLLCGVLDDRIYPSQIRARQLDKEYTEVASQFAGLTRVLQRVDENLDFSDLLSKVSSTEEKRQRTVDDIEKLRSERYKTGQSYSQNSDVLSSLRNDLDKVSRDIVGVQLDHDRLVLLIEDSSLLVEDLEKSIVQISQSQATGDALGPLVFSFCPSCFLPTQTPSIVGHCHLCKEEIKEDHEASRYARLRNELEMQLKESRTLQRIRAKELSDLKENLDGMHRIRDLLSDALLDQSRHYLTEADSKIESLTRSLGYLDRELIDLDRERRLADEVTQLSEQKKLLNEQLSNLKNNISDWISKKEQRQSSVYSLISKITAEIISSDLPSDIEDVSGEGVRFHFGDNSIVVNEKRGYSASSLTVIKNAFHLALLFASCVDARMKYPKFLLLDNIEDKGMTEERSKNFQKIILQLSKSTDVEHQIIFTTSMPESSLDQDSITVGPRYTESNKSLNIQN